MQKEIPILFNTSMVEAILAGRKSQTRRIIKPQPDDDGLHDHDRFPMSLESDLSGWWGTVEETGESKEFRCPYGYGGAPFLKNDLLWVRETWVNVGHNNCQDGREDFNTVVYKASENGREWEKNMDGWRWKPNIFLKKDDARIWLEKTKTKVQRLYDISEEDAIAEGVEQNIDGSWHDYLEPRRLWQDSAKASFQSLWIKINGEKSWDANPWLWVNHFTVLSTTGRP